LLVKLKPEWAWDPVSGQVRRRGIGLVPRLPDGARLAPMLAFPPPRPGHARWPAEVEMARYLQLTLPGADDERLADTARGWPFVESVATV
jgi:hypothetical protein